MSEVKDLSGTKFGELLAIQEVDHYITPQGKKYRRYFCVCNCGKTVIVRRQHLLSGHTKSCGCLTASKPKRKGIKACAYHPTAVNCTKLECKSCGWNPFNKDLRKERINKLLRKDGTDE